MRSSQLWSNLELIFCLSGASYHNFQNIGSRLDARFSGRFESPAQNNFILSNTLPIGGLIVECLALGVIRVKDNTRSGA